MRALSLQAVEQFLFAVNVELGVYVLNVCANGVFRYVELFADADTAPALGQKADNFKLPLGQAVLFAEPGKVLGCSA